MTIMTMADWQRLSDRINHVAPSATLAVDSKAKAMKAAGIDVIGFGAGEPNFATPAPIVDAAAAAVRDPKNYRYTPTPGLPELREAIAKKTLRDSGYEVDPSQVIVTNGGKQAVYESFQILLDEGDEVIIPSPFWTSYPEAVKLAGGVPIEVFAGADRGFEPSIEAIEAARTERTKAIIVNTPNNPTGAVWKPETVKAIAEWAIEHHVWVISDEIYEHLNYDGAKTTYIGAAVPEVRDQLLVLNGVAKTYAMPGWRVGWMIAPPEVAKAASKLQGHMTSNVNNIAQRAAIQAVSGSLDAVYEMREAFDARRKAIVSALNDIKGVNCPTPTGAFYAFADITALLGKPLGPNGTVSNTSSEFAAALLDEAHVAAVPGEAFGAPGYLRFSYALADDQLAEGMRRMKAYVEA
ncbi:aspartate aminotransferase [Bifidobacterium sp. DSM 109960]|uniref:Aminotransferase n=1 Tax=Bifidobacterium erythrocebi TaxID=2675325 RepID=A0A7Y0ES36_9BIFI|nr:pyridoxal phosphate-dependent aminotransferase [Bifidobacterium sp. DSM 109960]NMM95395.1 aspartate aminotransferase [Bifidobacterium sp. DSM 109960]